MARPEKTVEDYLVERVEFWGGQCVKLDVRGRRGRTDRVVTFPHHELPRPYGLIYYVELKAKGELPKAHQIREMERLDALGFAVRVSTRRKRSTTSSTKSRRGSSESRLQRARIPGSDHAAHPGDRKSTRLNSSHMSESRMPSSA